MAQRTLDTAFWDDESVAYLSRDARLLFACMVTDTSLTDDYGVLPASPMILRKHAFGYDDDLSVEDVKRLRDEIVRTCRNVILREIDGQEYILLKNFGKWQSLKYQRKTAYPSPTAFAQIPEKFPEVPEKFLESGEEIPMSSVGLDSDELNRDIMDDDENEEPAQSQADGADAPPASGEGDETPEVNVYLNATPARRILKAKFHASISRPLKHGPPKKFPNKDVAEKFDDAAARLNSNLGVAIDAALGAGLNSIVRIVHYVAKWQPNGVKSHARSTTGELDPTSRQISEAFEARARGPGPGT